jgi:hypothetical protein
LASLFPHLHSSPFYTKKLALTSPTGGGRSVGMVRSRTKATEFVCLVCLLYPLILVKIRSSLPNDDEEDDDDNNGNDDNNNNNFLAVRNGRFAPF